MNQDIWIAGVDELCRELCIDFSGVFECPGYRIVQHGLWERPLLEFDGTEGGGCDSHKGWCCGGDHSGVCRRGG